MRNLSIVFLVGSAFCFVLALSARLNMEPIEILPGGVHSDAFLRFADTCLLAAIACLLLSLVNANLKK